jgi:hypothetical protein
MTETMLSDEQRIRRVWDVLEIKNLMSRRAYYHSFHLRKLELETLWVQEPANKATASLGENNGYIVGMEAIVTSYLEAFTAKLQNDLEQLHAKNPSIQNTPENLGIGSMQIAQMTTPYVEIAGDGKTAQGLWYAPGQKTTTTADGVEAHWVYQLIGADFIREEAGWKLWHLFVGTDFEFNSGSDFSKLPIDLEENAPNMPFTIPMMAYTSRYNWYFYPTIPEPCATFANCVSNGPEGNPKFGGNITHE